MEELDEDSVNGSAGVNERGPGETEPINM